MWQIFYSLHEIDFYFTTQYKVSNTKIHYLWESWISTKQARNMKMTFQVLFSHQVNSHSKMNPFYAFFDTVFWLNPHQESWSLRWSCTIHPFCYHQPFTALRTCRSKVVKQWCKRTNRKDITSFLLIFCQ